MDLYKPFCTSSRDEHNYVAGKPSVNILQVILHFKYSSKYLARIYGFSCWWLDNLCFICTAPILFVRVPVLETRWLSVDQSMRRVERKLMVQVLHSRELPCCCDELSRLFVEAWKKHRPQSLHNLFFVYILTFLGDTLSVKKSIQKTQISS